MSIKGSSVTLSNVYITKFGIEQQHFTSPVECSDQNAFGGKNFYLFKPFSISMQKGSYTRRKKIGRVVKTAFYLPKGTNSGFFWEEHKFFSYIWVLGKNIRGDKNSDGLSKIYFACPAEYFVENCIQKMFL